MTRAAHALRAGIWPLVDAAGMRALDGHTIEKLGVPGELLMESAGRAVAEAVLALPESRDGVLVVCGSGNNGGDGLVVARHLHAVGAPVRAVLLGDPRRLRGDAAANWKRARHAGVVLEGARWRAPGRGVIVDAVFGTGLSRDVEGPAAAALRKIDAARQKGNALRVVAVDLPSGICADTGRVLGVAVRADETVTVSLPKLGLALEPGRSLAGRITVARIGIADDAPGTQPAAELWTRAAARAALPERPAAGHKGSFGHVLLAAGSEGKSGAAALAAEGAGRVGAGLVTVACPAGIHDLLEIKCTEAMTAPLPDTSERSFAASAEAPLLELAASRDAVGLGPGVGQAAETVKWVRAVLPKLRRPLAVDADGLNALAGELGVVARRSAPTVLTPHPGEAGRLLGLSAGQVNEDRPGAARRLAEATGAVVLLKGAATVTADPHGRICINATGGPALATGGTGDVLLGMVTGFLAQGLPAFEAAALAAHVHGAAADRLAARRGAAGVLAGDLARELPETLAALRAQAPADLGRLALRFPEP
jgi:NAD(P)H-hydrate epimerase